MELAVDIIEHFSDVEYEYPDFIVKMYCYKCNAHTSKFKLNVHKDYKWLDKKDLLSIDWALADLQIVKKLLEE